MNQLAEIYQGLIERTTELIFDQDLSQTRIILGMSEFFWAFACWYPGDTFDRPIYSTLKGIAPEGVWGIDLLCLGAVASKRSGILLAY